jgi:FixJ family two-component response regulator
MLKPSSLKPLIACTTKEHLFSDRIKAAANEIGTDFWASEDLGLTFEECRNRRLSCVVVDYDNVARENRFYDGRQRDRQSLIVVIPKGDIRAAFRAANVGAVNVIEKPLVPDELVVNLRTALASETRLQEFIESKKRFRHDMFECLTQREKAILALLMEGEPNKRVAAILDVGLRTVEGERAQVMKKLKVPSFVELIKTVSLIENDFLEARRTIFGSILPR